MPRKPRFNLPGVPQEKVTDLFNPSSAPTVYDEGLKSGHSFNLAAHSQGVALLYRSIQGLDFTADNTIKPGTV